MDYKNYRIRKQNNILHICRSRQKSLRLQNDSRGVGSQGKAGGNNKKGRSAGNI